MNPSKLDVGRGRMQAAAGAAILAMLSTLVSTLVAPRAMGQCTLTSARNFGAGNAPGPAPPAAFRAGYEYDVELYTASTGARRLLLMFNYGYGVMDLSNPASPTALTYADMRSDIPPVGDGQNYVTSMGVAPDGARAVFSLGPQAVPFHAAVGASSGTAFFLKGDFAAGLASGGTVVQKTSDGRYIAYALLSKLKAANITTLPGGALTAGSIPSELSTFPSGLAGTLQLAGNHLSYLSGGSVLILDASNPGSTPGSITTNFNETVVSRADFQRSSGSPVSLATVVDPAAPSALYVLVEFSGSTPSYSLMRVQGSTKTLIGSFDVPSVAGETWSAAGTSALITGGNNVYVLMWANRTAPSLMYRLYSTTVSNFGATPGAIDFNPPADASFQLGRPMRGFGSSSGTVNAFMGTGPSAYAFALSCQSQQSPAAADMTVLNGATQLTDGATVFLGETLTVRPTVSPSGASQAITSWGFDFDFHAGVASEDNGASAKPRLNAPDNGALGNPPDPPSVVTVVGPCDPNVAGTSPGSGAGCWNSVTSNSAFAGGSPDFTSTSPPAGTTVPLKFAFEASNSLGSAGARVFTLNWKVPAAKLKSTQILSGAALDATGSDGHPSASGYKWYFGDSPGSLTLSSCTTATCVPTLQATGAHYYWVTVPYSQIGYTTADCPGAPSCTSSLGSYVVTNFAPSFKVNGSAAGPVTTGTSQPLTISNSSQRGATVTGAGGYSYILCAIPCTGNEPYVPWGTMGDAPPSGSPPTTATIPNPGVGSWLLKIKVDYTNPSGTAFWPDPAGATGITVNVTNVIPEIRFNCAVGFGCTDVGSITVYANDVFTAFAYVGGGQDNSGAISWSAPGASQGNGSTQNGQSFSYSTAGTYTLTLTDNGTPATATITVLPARTTPLSVSASANPTSATTGTSIRFSCNASGGTAPYGYTWSGSVSGATANVSRTFSSAGSYQATCAVNDSASRTASATANVSITPSGGGGGGGGNTVEIRFNCTPGFGCTDVNRIGVYTTDVFTAYAYVNGGEDDATSISWSAPGASQGNGSTQNGQPFSYSNAGTYTLTLNGYGTPYTATITVAQRGGGGGGGGGGPTGCTDVDFKVFDGGSGSQIPADQFGVVEVIVNQPLSFTASATTFASYDWDFGDGTQHGSGATATHTYLSGGSPTVKLTVPANGTCKSQVSHDLYVAGPAGPTGSFVARYADSSPFLATQVASGKAMSFLAIDTADTYTWDFGDGSLPVTGQTASHTYNESVVTDRTVKLTVTMGALPPASTTKTFTVLPPPEPPKWFVAGISYLQGSLAGTLWQTDVTVFNPDPSRPGTYSLAFLDARNPVDAANLVWKTINLPAQQSISSPNILAFFGQPLGSFGALLVRGDTAPVPPVLTARTFNSGDPTKGTFGLSVPSTQLSSGLTPQAALAQQFLIGLSDDDTAYTNIGLLNLTTDWSHARLTFLDRSGATSLGQVNVDVPPYGVSQFTRPLFEDPPNGVGFKDPLDTFSVKVTVLSGGSVFPYATVIDRRSTDAIVATASDRPSSTYRVPGIIRLQGANNTVWRSRFYITNPSTTSRKASISYSYIPCDATGCKSRVTGLQSDVSLLPGETLWSGDFPKVWLAGFGFDVSDTTAYASSYVDVFPAAGDPNQEPLLVLGETYNDQPSGPVGLQVPGFTDADAASKTGANRRLLLGGLVSNDSYRSNVALFLQSGTSGRCTVRVLSDTGVELAHQDIALGGATTFVQLNDAGLFAPLPGNKDRLAVVIDSFDGAPISAYATVVDNTSGDATFLKAQPAP